ncbi:nucleotide exchange factor GrpE [Spirulina sp. 06S082]|uniref:nucleotide exchange factor GrpE n=1 Tax=Spirulina sp. 06S082 TaxID=3110248 RepID=UPI002B1F57E2|nr:nucleotide exchange factor GrpE [Spirulina sp. 06S082]MEA5468746.1 nucleotide exchange factor GrpE [Spirulina sp. 06S082]
MIDDQKQSEETFSPDQSGDKVKDNSILENPQGEDSPEVTVAQDQTADPQEIGSMNQGDRGENLEESTLEALELKDLEFNETEQGQSGTSLKSQPETSGGEKEGESYSAGVQGAQVQIMEALQFEIESLKRQLAKQTEQAESLKAQSVRIAADFDNFRKRTQKEKEEREVFAKRNTINELLPVVDNFERARSQIRPANDGEMGIHKSYQGVYKNLVDCLKRLGVSAMRPEGQEFDPNYHEAMLREQTAEYPEGVVIEQLVRGYMIGDRVLRHAMVKVAAAPEDETNFSTEGNIDSNSESETPSEE